MQPISTGTRSNSHGNREALNDEDFMVLDKVLLKGTPARAAKDIKIKPDTLAIYDSKAIQKRVEEKPALQKGKRHHRLQPVLVDFNTYITIPTFGAGT